MFSPHIIHFMLLIYSLIIAAEIISVRGWLKRIKTNNNDYIIKQINISFINMGLSVFALLISDIVLFYDLCK